MCLCSLYVAAGLGRVAERNRRVTTIVAALEAVNECEAGNSPPGTGGVAAPSRKRCEATAAAQTGWSGLPRCFGMRSLDEVPFSTTPSAPLKEASRLLLDVASTPPVSGGEFSLQQLSSISKLLAQ